MKMMKQWTWGLSVGLVLPLLGCKTMDEKPEATMAALPEQCTLKPETGKCKAAFRHYFFNPSSGQCEQFIYGGCGGVVPFKTLEACQQTCEH